MKKTAILFLVILGFCLHQTEAQNPKDLAGTPAVQEVTKFDAEIADYPEDNLRNKMTKILSTKGKSLGVINSDGSLYVIASASTQRPSNMPGFINSRNVAFSIAVLTAKMNLLRKAGEQITSGRGFTMLEDIIEGEDPDAAAKASKLQKASLVADKSLDKALSYLGVPEEEIKTMNEEQKKTTYSQTYNQTISSFVAGMVKGVSIVKIIEGEMGNNDYQIAVCLKFSPEFQSLASAIQARGYYPSNSLKKKPNPSELVQNMKIEDLVMEMGTKVLFNQNGEMVVLGFGQQEVRQTDHNQSSAFSRANSQARLRAINNIKYFAAEDIQAEEMLNDVEKVRDYTDGTSAYFSAQKWKLGVESKQTTLTLATEQVRVWKGRHPISGHYIAGVVVMWSPSTDENAKKFKQQLNAGPKTNPTKDTTKKQIEKTKKSKQLESTLGEGEI